MVSLPLHRRSRSPASEERHLQKKKAKAAKEKSIPTSFIDSLRTYSKVGSMSEAEKSQEALLRRLPYFRLPGEPDPAYPSLVAHQYKLQLANGTEINTIEIKAVRAPGEDEQTEEGEANILLHGYALGGGFFWKNFETFGQIAAKTGRRAFILDWMGMGLSSRPSPKVFSKSHPSDAARAAAAESFFLEPLLEFFDIKKISTAQLVGHSLGGYLTLAFALRFPTRVSNMILLSPAGIPSYPESSSKSKVDGKLEQALEMEIGMGSPSGSEEDSDDDDEPSTSTGPRKIQTFKGPTGDSGKLMKKFYSWMWESNMSPLEVVRMMGPFGQLLLGKYSTHRFSSLPSSDDRYDLSYYLANLIALPGSGEYSVASLLRPGAFARSPLLGRVSSLGSDIGVVFAYGDKDWMDEEGGREAVKAMKKAGNRKGSVFVCPEAGHHLYMDNADVVNKLFWDRLAPPPGVEGFPSAPRSVPPSRRASTSATEGALSGFTPSQVRNRFSCCCFESEFD
ncbi:Alpha/Beta hydrolase protein [Mrakia frigida]|uniref:Alpha/Beta hydrolase protein n=1 Tax=Mrakia frigida TaxID=29902 RepID=UPI003FCBEE71